MLETAGVASCLLDAFADREWYAAYTCAQHEKTVSQQICAKGIEVLLPTAPVERRRKYRTVQLDLPLFPGYVFVRMRLEERLKVLSVPSVVRLVTFNGKPAAVDSSEIEAIRACLASPYGVQPHPYVATGSRVRVKCGALQGVSGVIVRHDAGCRLVISIQLLHQALSVEIHPWDVEPA